LAVARPGCLSKMTARKGLPVEYREIRYTVRARIERNEWTVSIHPGGIEGARRVVTGPRERAELLARSMINRWYERAPRAQRGAVNLDNRGARRIAANIAKQPELVRDRSVSSKKGGRSRPSLPVDLRRTNPLP
jgi:hypothetical protein